MMKRQIFIPAATVFFSSGCIMALELVAGRLIARHVGSSLYTWTSVIGIVLAGITIGNYLGGRIADRFNARKSLSAVFAASSIACVTAVIMNELVPEMEWLWQFGLVFRIFSGVALMFLVPSLLLGMISPIVAKMALEGGMPVGRTVGDIYAWGAAGSIIGTFLAGFYLIGAIGTIAIIWAVSGCMLLMAILYWRGFWLNYIWTAVFLVLVVLGNSDLTLASSLGASLMLRERSDPDIIYEEESNYGYIAVKQVSHDPDTRLFIQDTVRQSMIVLDNPEELLFDYFRMFAIVTHRTCRGKQRLSTLTFGGGGCAFPRYIEKIWPQSRIDVVEIDPQVMKAARQAFGLAADTTISTYAMDARNYVDDLIWQRDSGRHTPTYDIIYGDAFSGSVVPFQLVTRQFNDRVAQILVEDGAYVMNIIDSYDSGLFVGAVLNTLDKTFSKIRVMTTDVPIDHVRNSVIVASNKPVDLDNLNTELLVDPTGLRVLDEYEISILKTKAKGMVLTDDHAPVEDLLSPVVSGMARRRLAATCMEKAYTLRAEGRYEQSNAQLVRAARIYPRYTVDAYQEIGLNLSSQGKWQEALEAIMTAVRYNDKASDKKNIPQLYRGAGIALKRLGRESEARENFEKAIRGFEDGLRQIPDDLASVVALANTLAEIGNFERAAKYFKRATDMEPHNPQHYMLLARALMAQGANSQAVTELQRGITILKDNGDNDGTARLQSLLDSLAAPSVTR